MVDNQFWASNAADFSGALMSSDLLDCCHPLQNTKTYSARDIRHCCQVTALLIYWIRPCWWEIYTGVNNFLQYVFWSIRVAIWWRSSSSIQCVQYNLSDSSKPALFRAAV